MSTLAEVLKLEVLVLQEIEWFGVEKKFIVEFKQRFKELGEIICQENNLTPAEAIKLSPETQFGPMAEANFTELKKWLEIQEQSLAMSTSAK